MANKAVGEIDVVLGGTEYTLRPTFNAVMEFEDKCVSVFEAMRAADKSQSIPLKYITAAFHSCIKAAWKPSQGRPPTFDEIGLAIRKDGVIAHAASYATILGNMLTGEQAMQEAAKANPTGKE